MTTGPDETGLYKWLVLLAAFLLLVNMSFIMSAVGVFYVIFIQNLSGSSSLISLASSVSIAVGLGTGPIVGYMIDKYGFRRVSIVGSIIGTLGLSLTAFVTSPWQLIITFGVFSGLGMGTIYLAAMVAIGQYFTKRRHLAIGIAVTGAGIGPMISPLVLTALETHFGWRGAILLFSGIVLHTVLFSTLLKPVRMTGIGKEYPKDKNSLAHYKKKHEATEFSKSSRLLFTNIPYCINLVQTTLFAAGLCIIQVHIGGFALPLGYSTDQAAMLVFSMGIGSACARVILGVALQLLALDPIKMYMVSCILLGSLTIAYSFGNSYGSLMAISATIGFFTASWGIFPALIAIKLVGIEHFAISYGYVNSAAAVGYILAGPVSGWIYETTNNYPVVFFVSGGLFIASVVTLVLTSILHERQYHLPTFQSEEKTITGPIL